MIIKAGIAEKSVLYGARYNSTTLNDNHKVLYGRSFLIDGFILEELSEKNSAGESTPGANLSIKLSPGRFSSDGVLVDVKEGVQFKYEESPRSPRILVAYTADNKPETPVVLDFIGPQSLTNSMAVIGYYYPSAAVLDESTRKSLQEHPLPTFRPASRVRMEDLAAMVHNGSQFFSKPATEFSANRVGGYYRVNVTNIPMMQGDPRMLVFFMGILLEETTHYIVESPGSLLIKATTSFGTADDAEVTFEGSINSAFVDIIFSDDIVFREKHGFLSPEDGGSNKFKFSQNNGDLVKDGSTFPIVFSSNQVQVGGGTLIGIDRYALTQYTQDSEHRDSIQITKRKGWETEINNGWVSDEYTGSPIATITIIGVKNIHGAQVHLRDETLGSGTLLPIVYKNLNHVTDIQYVDSSIPYIANSGQLQVWVNGKLSPADHFYANQLSSTASSTPKFHGKFGYQHYVNDLSAGSFEIGNIPIVTSRFAGVTHTSSYARSIASLVFKPNYLLGRSVDVVDGSLTFAGLEESVDQPGITEAVFNMEGNRHWDDALHAKEFWSTSITDFNGNYFVTFESLAGISAGATSASYSILNTLTCSVTMFSDVPQGFGHALTGSFILNYAPGGFFATGTPPKLSDGGYLTDSNTGLYTTVISGANINKFYSEKNPIVTLGGLQAFMSNWADALGFSNDPDVAPRTHDFTAGVEYNADGSIDEGFASWLANRNELGLDSNLSLVQCIENVANNIGTTEFSFGYAHGFAFGGCVINLYNGMTGRFEGATDKNNRRPSDTDFQSGIYFGSIGFEPPYNIFATSDAIDSIRNDPNQWHYGIITPAQSGTPFGANEVGYRSLTVNNICAVVVPSSGGATICKYQFCYLRPGTTSILNSGNPKTQDADLGIKIYCDNGKAQGQGKKYQLAKWFVIGPIESTATNRFLSGNNNENWYRIDSERAPID